MVSAPVFVDTGDFAVVVGYYSAIDASAQERLPKVVNDATVQAMHWKEEVPPVYWHP